MSETFAEPRIKLILNSLSAAADAALEQRHLPDRHFGVPPGMIVRTGYVEVFKVRLACRERMAIGDVDRAFQRVLQAGDVSLFPTPNGEWDGDTFVIKDGRHEWIASVMLGKTHILVAWIELGESRI